MRQCDKLAWRPHFTKCLWPSVRRERHGSVRRSQRVAGLPGQLDGRQSFLFCFWPRYSQFFFCFRPIPGMNHVVTVGGLEAPSRTRWFFFLLVGPWKCFGDLRDSTSTECRLELVSTWPTQPSLFRVSRGGNGSMVYGYHLTPTMAVHLSP